MNVGWLFAKPPGMYIIAFIIFGLVVGLIARAVMPGDQKMGFVGTALLGMAGSLVGGILGNALFGGRWDQPVAAGWIGSIVASVLLLAVFTMVGRRRSLV